MKCHTLQALVFSSLTSHYNPYALKYVNIGVLFIFNLAYAGAILINFFGCLWFYVATLEGLDNSWVNGTRLCLLLHLRLCLHLRVPRPSGPIFAVPHVAVRNFPPLNNG